MSACRGQRNNCWPSTNAQVCSRGWTGIKNGELLRRAVSEFDLFITSDQGIRYQQNLVSVGIAILQLSTNDIHRIRAGTAAIRSAIAAIRKDEFHELMIP
jgi:hypothetical protein